MGVLFDLFHKLPEKIVDSIVLHVELENPEDAGFEEVITVLDRRRFRRQDENGAVRRYEEIERVEGGAGTEIEHHVLGLEVPDMAHEFEFLVMIQVGDEKSVFRAPDEAHAVEGGHGRGVGQRGDLIGEEIAQVGMGMIQPEEGMEIGRAQIDIHEEHIAPPVGEAQGKARRDKALARPALAASDGPDDLVHGCREDID